jgi:two-component system, NtrC family, sensor kinase
MPRGLAQKMIVSLTVIVLIVGAIAGAIDVRAQERHLLDAMLLGADQLSRGISAATWHAMLLDDRDAAYEVMQTVASKHGIERIRIFNRDGQVMYSTRRGDPERRVGKSDPVCAICHSTKTPLITLDPRLRSRVTERSGEGRQLTIVTPVYNEPSCSQAACHAHPANTKVLGVLDVTLGLAEVDREVSSAKLRVYVVYTTQVLLISVFIVFFTRRFLGRPIASLIAAAKEVSEMNLERPIEIPHSSEDLGKLAMSFETMRERLRQALAELNEWTQTLESRVKERTDQLNAAHQKLLQSDRLASLGQLSASVAHEINNPVAGVLNLSMLMQRILKDDGIPPERIPEFRKYLAQVSSETTRVGRIVSDLLAFSRRSKPHRAGADLNKIVASTVSLIAHKLKLANVELDMDLDAKLPLVWCDGSQIQQVVLNLMLNGAEALHGKEGGRLTITTRHDERGGSVTLAIRDNGEGISPENLTRIFDPFFTTKPEGKGVGLGLAVIYGIVQAHGGEVTVKSDIGKGTTFNVTLPLAQSGAPGAALPTPGTEAGRST